jgi:hypothetical protein
MRTRDYLEPLTGSVKRKKFAVFDIESKDGDSQDAGFTRPFLVGTYDPLTEDYAEFKDEPHLASRDWRTRHYQPGGCIDKLLNYLLQKKFSGYNFYAHNGGSFDHLFLLAWLNNHRDEFGFEVVPVQSSIQMIQVWRWPEKPEDPIREKWTFLDSMKLLPMGLEKACQTFGLPGKVDHDLNMHEDNPHWRLYLRQDCIALAEVLLRTYDLVENRLGGEVGMTAPSTSMKLFRRKFLGRKHVPARIPRHAHWSDCKSKKTCPGCAHQWNRLAYYGGRTEMFRAYGERLHYYDINSSYVAAMQETMPAGDREVTDTLDWGRYEHYVGFVECTVEIPEDCYLPPLPHRSVATGKLIFPVGRFSGVWDCEELKLLDDPLVKGRIVEVKKVVWYRRKHLFSDMVAELYALRDKSLPDYDEGLSALAKLLGNSLYGKFGMKQDRTSIVFTREPREGECRLCGKPSQCFMCKDCEGSKPTNGDPMSDVWYQQKRVDAPYIIPHIAAHITSLARVRIFNYMKAAIEAGGNLYYADTDSVITDVVLPSTTHLGGLKDEYPGIELRGSFVQPKVYMVERMDDEPFKGAHEAGCKDKEACKGCKKSKVTMKGFPQKMRTRENLEKLLAGETLSWKRLEKVRTLAREKFTRGPLMADVTKSFKSKYDKRAMLPDGNSRALVLDEQPAELEAAAE